MKALFLLTLLISTNAFSQILGGSAIDEGRKLLIQSDFKVEGTVNGVATWELAVNREGEVTSARLTDSDIKSTPTKIAMRNYLMKFKFDGATYYPKFQHVNVRVTSYKP